MWFELRQILHLRYEELLEQGRAEQEEAVQKRQDEILTLQQTVSIRIRIRTGIRIMLSMKIMMRKLIFR